MTVHSNQFVAFEYQPGFWHVYRHSHETLRDVFYVRFLEKGEDMPRIYINQNACQDRAQQLNKERSH